MNIDNIKSVGFIFENCEYIKIPIENFKSLEIEKVGDYYSLSCIIKGVDNIENDLYLDRNPLKRIHRFNDIVSIEIEFKNGCKHEFYMAWEGNEFTNNYQTSEMINYNEIRIEINENVLMSKMKDICRSKAEDIFDVIYQEMYIDTCSDCCYYEECRKLKETKNVDICEVLGIMTK